MVRIRDPAILARVSAGSESGEKLPDDIFSMFDNPQELRTL
jgi:hypothetical protein